jgi:Domain of unknown function (DUF4136)
MLEGRQPHPLFDALGGGLVPRAASNSATPERVIDHVRDESDTCLAPVSEGMVIMLRGILTSSLLLLFSGVAVASEVRVDVDRHADFSRYRTISVEIGPLVRSDGTIDEQNTLTENRLRRAVADEFLARGIESTDAASDLVVRVSSREAERNQIVTTGWGYPGAWQRRWGYWRRPYGWWGGYDGTVLTRRYLVGFTTLDVIDRRSGALVYRAEVTQELGNNPDKDVTKAVDQGFKKFPVRENSK